MLRKIKDILRLNDLSEQEVAVYVALLKLQKATIPAIREKCALPNITVYRCIKNLQERGMIETELLNKKQAAYKPLTLEKLIQKVAKAQRKLRRMELELRNLDSLIPYMNNDVENIEPEIEVRTGFDAFREEYLKMPDIYKDQYLHLGNSPKFWEVAKLNYESPEEIWFINRRMKKNLFARALDLPSKTGEEIQKRDSLEKRTFRMVPNLPIMNDFLMIAEKQVSHFVNDTENPRVVIIRNPELVNAHHAQFGQLWNQ